MKTLTAKAVSDRVKDLKAEQRARLLTLGNGSDEK